jgi:hypothetical protein
MPGGELQDGLSNFFSQVAEFVVNPGLEPGQMRVLVGEEPVMDKQGTQVIGRSFCRLSRCVEAFVSQGSFTA